MNLNRALLLLPLILYCANSWAHTPDEGKITFSLGGYYYQPQWPSDVGVDPPVLRGAGLIAEGDLDKNGGIEIGFFHLSKVYLRTDGDDYLAERIQRMYITLGYRHWFERRFSGALAFFSSYSMGDPETYRSRQITGRVIETSARDITEYGFDFSVQWEFLYWNKVAFLLDGRYSLSVTSKTQEHSNFFGALILLKFEIQEEGTPVE